MAKTYVATSAELETVQTQVTTLETTVTAPSTGLSDKVTANETAVTNLSNTVGADDTSGLRKRIADNETAIGDANSGLIKGQNDLISVVGADNTQGLQKRVVDLETSVGLDDTTGLRKDSVDLKAKTDGFTYDDTAKRITQVTAPVADATDDKHVLTKKDGDALYGGASTITASAGGYNSDTASDTWNEICKVGNISIEVRYPDTENSVARVINNTGGTVVAIYETNDEGTFVNNSSNISNGSGLVINPSGTASSGIKSFRAGIYTSPGVNTEAYTVEVYMRNTSAGIRIACSIVGKF